MVKKLLSEQCKKEMQLSCKEVEQSLLPHNLEFVI